VFWRIDDVMVQVWKDKRLMPYALAQYNKLMKGVDRADQYLSYYSVLRKTVKWSKKSDTVSAKLCSLQKVFVQDIKYKQKSKVQEHPAQGRKVLYIISPESK